MAHVVRREQLLGLDLDAEQVADRVRIFRAIQAMEDRPARIRMGFGGLVDPGLDIRDEAMELGRIGPGHSLRRHHPRTQLQHDFLECSGVVGGLSEVDLLERKIADLEGIVVADGAVIFNQLRTRRRGRLAARRRKRGREDVNPRQERLLHRFVRPIAASNAP